MQHSRSFRIWHEPRIVMGKNDAMNADHMIDYVLGRLEGPEREHLEAVLHSDPEAAAHVRCLSRAVYLLLDDGDELPYPAGLAERTIVMVARSRTRPRSILD